MTDTKKSTSKIFGFFEHFYQANKYDADAWGSGGYVLGAVAGAIAGWNILPAETLNVFQLLGALVGLVVGGWVGAIVGFVGWYVFIIGILVVLVAIMYFLGTWLVSN